MDNYYNIIARTSVGEFTYRIGVVFGLVCVWSYYLSSLLDVCGHHFDEFAAMCAELGWIVSDGSVVN